MQLQFSGNNANTPKKSTVFLSSYGRHTLPIIGDGNCLFRCFSYIIFGTQERHFDMRLVLVEFMALNPSYFTAYCHPSSVQNHVCRMKQNYVWGTQAEILAATLFFKKPVYVALQKSECGEYYWAKYSSETNEQQLVYPNHETTFMLPAEVNHFEICHLNNNHYEVVVTINNKTFPVNAPYTGDSSAFCVDLTQL